MKVVVLTTNKPGEYHSQVFDEHVKVGEFTGETYPHTDVADRAALITGLRWAHSLDGDSVRLVLPYDCNLIPQLGAPDEFWRDVVQLLDEFEQRVVEVYVP